MLSPAALLLVASAAAAPMPPPLTVDLDGDGAPEIIVAQRMGSKIRIDVQNAAGQRVARVKVASPDSSAAVTLTSGPLGDGGAILEVSSAGAERACRSFWRLRGRDLAPLPLLGSRGRAQDCAPASEGWSDRWSRPSPDVPAEYIREGTRTTPQGEHHRTEVYRFTGFELRFDPKRSTAEIGGVPIPDFAPVLLYPRPLVRALLSCFDLSGFRTAATLRMVTDREDGVFAAILTRSSDIRRFPITASRPGADREELLLTAGSGPQAAHLSVRLGSDLKTPLEIATEGGEPEWNTLYSAVTQLAPDGLQLYPDAEDQLAYSSLRGAWDNSHGTRIQVNVLSLSPAVLDFDKQKVAVSFAAPAGADVLLVPRDGSRPRTALRLRGPNAFTRFPVECPTGAAPGTSACRLGAPGENFRRVGSSMNVP